MSQVLFKGCLFPYLAHAIASAIMYASFDWFMYKRHTLIIKNEKTLSLKWCFLVCESHAAIITLKFLRYCSALVLAGKSQSLFIPPAIRLIENQNNQTPIKNTYEPHAGLGFHKVHDFSPPPTTLHFLPAFDKIIIKPKPYIWPFVNKWLLSGYLSQQVLASGFSGSCPYVFLRNLTLLNRLFVKLIREKDCKTSALVVITLQTIKRHGLCTFVCLFEDRENQTQIKKLLMLQLFATGITTHHHRPTMLAICNASRFTQSIFCFGCTSTTPAQHTHSHPIWHGTMKLKSFEIGHRHPAWLSRHTEFQDKAVVV